MASVRPVLPSTSPAPLTRRRSGRLLARWRHETAPVLTDSARVRRDRCLELNDHVGRIALPPIVQGGCEHVAEVLRVMLLFRGMHVLGPGWGHCSSSADGG